MGKERKAKVQVSWRDVTPTSDHRNLDWNQLQTKNIARNEQGSEQARQPES